MDCKLSDWNSWTDCSEPCNTGKQSRDREIVTVPKYGGKKCDTTEETQDCNTDICHFGNTVCIV